MKLSNSQHTVHYIMTLSMVVFKMKEYIGQIKKKGPLMHFWSRKLTVDQGSKWTSVGLAENCDLARATVCATGAW